MITLRIQFLQNSLTADLSQLPIRLKDDLQHMSVLTPPNLILLDNARTLKIELYPEDNRGERIVDLVNKKSDTLGAVNNLCYSIRCMDARDKACFFNNLDNGAYKTRNADSEVKKCQTVTISFTKNTLLYQAKRKILRKREHSLRVDVVGGYSAYSHR